MDIPTPSLRTAAADLNGLMRGTRRPASAAARIEYEGDRLPLSALALDIWGRETSRLSLATTRGGPDGQLRVTERGPVRMPWLDPAATLVPMWMFTEDGKPFDICPRHALSRVLARIGKHGWSVRLGAEIDVTLVDAGAAGLSPVQDPVTRAPLEAGAACGVDELDRFAPFLDAVQEGASAMDIALSAAVSEPGIGQIALTLDPGAALRTIDDLWLLKALVRGTAQRHGLTATFLAKPFADEPGSGMRLRFAFRDAGGANLFDNGLLSGTELMRQAVAGCISAMPGAMLAFAPHAGSYLRTVPRSNAPTGAAWGYENRTCAIRIPGGTATRRVIEHRTAGADANPYLVAAAILGAALMGIEDELAPPQPVIGNAYDQRILHLPTDWDEAIGRFEASPKIARIFPARLIETLVAVKRQEQARAAAMTPEALVRATCRLV